jgi:hypothetical protein
MAKLADAQVSKACTERCPSSSLGRGTKQRRIGEPGVPVCFGSRRSLVQIQLLRPILDHVMKLFLDDIRDPPDETWIVVRSFREAHDWVKQHGFPTLVSLDHDLGGELTGMDFVHFLINLDLDTGTMPDDFSFIVHSANPVGAGNIAGLLDQYLRMRQK